MPSTEPVSQYQERLLPSAWWWLLVAGVAIIIGIIFIPVNQSAAMIAGAVVAILGSAWLWSFAAGLRIHAGWFYAGRAQVPLAQLGQVTILDPDEVRELLGPGSDARSFVLHRPWVPAGVRIDIADPGDPTPYWIISTRDPEQLCAQLTTSSSAGNAGNIGDG